MALTCLEGIRAAERRLHLVRSFHRFLTANSFVNSRSLHLLGQLKKVYCGESD